MSEMTIIWALIQSYLGKPYKWGGDDPLAGFDCSGSAKELLNSCGLGPSGDTTAQGIYNLYRGRTVTEAQFGTLALYGSSSSKITHIVFCLNDKLMFEFGGGGSHTNTLQDAINQNAYGRFREIKRRNDLVALVNPPWPWIVSP